MPSSSRDRRLEVDELLIHFKKISTISHKYAINKPTSSYSPQQTQALETILKMKDTTERQRRSTIDSWTAAAMRELMPTKTTKKSDDDDVKIQQRSNDTIHTEEEETTQQNSEVQAIETFDTRQSCEDCNSKIVSASEQLTPTNTKKRRNNNAPQCSTPIDDWVDSVMREVAHMMPKEVITTNKSRSTLDDGNKAQEISTSCESSILSALTASTISSASSSCSSPSATEVPSFSDIQRRHKALKDKMEKIKTNRQEGSKRHFNHSSRVPGQAPSIQSTLEKLGQRKQTASGIRTSFTSTSTSATEGLSVCSSSCIADEEINETTVNNLLLS